MKVATIILHYGAVATTSQTLRSLLPKLKDTTLYLVNQSSADLSSLTSIFPQTVLLNPPRNLGFAGGVNYALDALLPCGFDAVFLLNNDVRLESGTLSQLTRLLVANPTLGAVAPLLHHPRGYDWGATLSRWSGLVRHRNWPNPPKTVQKVSHLAAAALLIPVTTFKTVGTFDPRYFLYYEDVDFSLRLAQAKLTLALTPEVVVWHAPSTSTTPLKRTLWQWRSHLVFVTRYLFHPILPTAYAVDLFLYPLYLLKSLFIK